MVPPGVPIVSLLLGGMAPLAMSPYPGPPIWLRCVIAAVVVVVAYTAILISVRRVRRASPMARAVVTTIAIVVPPLVVLLTVLPQFADLSGNWLIGAAAVLATMVVFRLGFAVGELISPKSPVNLVAAVVGVAGYLMAIPPVAALDDQIWRAVGLAAVTGIVVGGVAAWLLAGAQYYFP